MHQKKTINNHVNDFKFAELNSKKFNLSMHARNLLIRKEHETVRGKLQEAENYHSKIGEKNTERFRSLVIRAR